MVRTISQENRAEHLKWMRQRLMQAQDSDTEIMQDVLIELVELVAELNAEERKP